MTKPTADKEKNTAEEQSETIRAHEDAVLKLTRDEGAEPTNEDFQQKEEIRRDGTMESKTTTPGSSVRPSMEQHFSTESAPGSATSPSETLLSKERRESNYQSDVEEAKRRSTALAVAIDREALEAEIRQAILKETVTASIVIPNQEVEATPAAQSEETLRMRSILWTGALVLLVACVAVVVIVGTVMTLHGDGRQASAIDNTPMSVTPTTIPTFAPTSSPAFTLTPEQNAVLAQLKLASFDSGMALEDPTSPQYRAFRWLLQDPSVTESRGDEREIYSQLSRYSLAVIYFSTGGSTWRNNDGWLSSESTCAWYRGPDVACKSSGGVPGLRLPHNNLTGTLPPEIGSAILSMNVVDLSDNQLSGTVPPQLFPSPYRLKTIRLDRNRLTGIIPTEIHEYVNPITLSRGDKPTTVMNVFTASGNKLSGLIPSELVRLSALEMLDLHNNTLSGSLPTELAELSRLQFIRLDHNTINGTIPDKYGNWLSLGRAYFDSNHIRGKMPESICLLEPSRLSADCKEVECSCCTHCCEPGGACKWTSRGAVPADQEDDDRDQINVR